MSPYQYSDKKRKITDMKKLGIQKIIGEFIDITLIIIYKYLSGYLNALGTLSWSGVTGLRNSFEELLRSLLWCCCWAGVGVLHSGSVFCAWIGTFGGVFRVFSFSIRATKMNSFKCKSWKMMNAKAKGEEEWVYENGRW